MPNLRRSFVAGDRLQHRTQGGKRGAGVRAAPERMHSPEEKEHKVFKTTLLKIDRLLGMSQGCGVGVCKIVRTPTYFSLLCMM